MTAPAHIAMIGTPIISHVLPSLPLIRELVKRGHRVTYANDPLVTDQIRSVGAEFVPVTSTLPVKDNDWPADPIAASALFLADAIQSLPQLLANYDHPADLYLYDIGAYAARALAESQNRPLVQLSPTFVAWEGFNAEVTAHLRKLPGADAYRETFTRWLAECGATTKEVDVFSGPPSPTLALIPRAMQPNADRVDADAVTFVGPCFDTCTESGGWTRPATADRILLISLGTAYTRQPAFYRECVAAFGELAGWHVVLQTGKYTDPSELGYIPPNIEVHSWVPQRAILEQADAFVTHAGMGSCAEGLQAGVPMIAVPQGAEQFMNADRLVELGVARRVDTADATTEPLRSALNELVTDPERIIRSKNLRAETRAEGGTRHAADVVEDMLTSDGGPAT